MRSHIGMLFLAGLVLAVYRPAASQGEGDLGLQRPLLFDEVVGSGRIDLIPIKINADFHCILLEAEVNGRAAILMLDTGASHTFLSPEIADLEVASLRHAVVLEKGSGFVGTGRWTKATVRIGAMLWSDHSVIVLDGLHDLSKSLKEKVDGVLGEDLLGDFKVVIINYKNHTLTLAR